MFARIDLHFAKSSKCGANIEMENFWQAYKKEVQIKRKRIKANACQRKYLERKKQENDRLFKENISIHNKKYYELG